MKYRFIMSNRTSVVIQLELEVYFICSLGLVHDMNCVDPFLAV